MDKSNDYTRSEKPYGNGANQVLPYGQSKKTTGQALPVKVSQTDSSAMNSKERKKFFLEVFGNY